MGAQGTSTINFGTFPGASDASVAVTGQGGILAGSLIEAWIVLTATADHSADEHLVDAPVVRAGNIVAGTGFTIYAAARDGIPVPDATPIYQGQGVSAQTSRQEHGRAAPMVYGQWSVDWVGN